MSARVLIITDRLETSSLLRETVRRRAAQDRAEFRLLVTNPARAEFHLVHAERHVAVEQAQPALLRMLEELTAETGTQVSGAVSIRHDAFEAVEEDVLVRPADEIIVAVHEHDLARQLHHDLPHRLESLHLPVTLLPSPVASQ